MRAGFIIACIRVFSFEMLVLVGSSLVHVGLLRVGVSDWAALYRHVIVGSIVRLGLAVILFLGVTRRAGANVGGGA